MEITKQKTWMFIEVMIASYLIISSCMQEEVTYSKTLFPLEDLSYKPFKSIIFEIVTSLKNIP